MSESSDHALRTAKALGLLGGSRTTVLHAFQPFAKGKMSLAGVKTATIQEYAESEQQRAIGELNEFVDDPSLKSKNWILRADEGTAMEVISRAVAEVRDDLLILGTRGRTGLLKMLLGSVTEEATRTLPVDILAAPAARN
jgi:nucleotide-binding universal stress UspA family protein